MGRDAGNKYNVLRTAEQRKLISEILNVIDAGQLGAVAPLSPALSNNNPAVRYWAATAMGLSGTQTDTMSLEPLLADESAGVRIAAALATCRLQPNAADVSRLADEIASGNYITGMYALRALELLGTGVSASQTAAVIEARESPYEFTRRIARRFSNTLNDVDR